MKVSAKHVRQKNSTAVSCRYSKKEIRQQTGRACEKMMERQKEIERQERKSWMAARNKMCC